MKHRQEGRMEGRDRTGVRGVPEEGLAGPEARQRLIDETPSESAE
jgi:hypothetical protein